MQWLVTCKDFKLPEDGSNWVAETCRSNLNYNKLINEKLICAFRWSVLPSKMTRSLLIIKHRIVSMMGCWSAELKHKPHNSDEVYFKEIKEEFKLNYFVTLLKLCINLSNHVWLNYTTGKNVNNLCHSVEISKVFFITY